LGVSKRSASEPEGFPRDLCPWLAIIHDRDPLSTRSREAEESVRPLVFVATGLGIKIAANFVYQHPTLAALSTGLADHMGLTLQDPAGS
jgi:hypothetical protein